MTQTIIAIVLTIFSLVSVQSPPTPAKLVEIRERDGRLFYLYEANDDVEFIGFRTCNAVESGWWRELKRGFVYSRDFHAGYWIDSMYFVRIEGDRMFYVVAKPDTVTGEIEAFVVRGANGSDGYSTLTGPRCEHIINMPFVTHAPP